MQKRILKQPSRRLIIAVSILLILAVLLALDLRARGAVWGALWNVTGEEEPLAQVRGFVEYLGNYLRPPLQLDPLTPIQHSDVTPYGINTFLQQEVEVAKRERQLQMIAEAGFGMIRQQFPWEDIEIDGRGDFIDRRNDLNGDGTPDEINAWAKYDNIVDLAEQYGIQIQARLDNPPKWSNSKVGGFGPPDDYQDFVNYAVAVAERYQGRIRYYQVWNEPNGNGEWGSNQPVNPEQYTDLLCRTYTALKAVDPDIVVISGPLSPTVSLTDSNLNDFIFLQRMYDAGAGACFDVMAAQGYGFFSGPTDRRLRPQTLTFARSLYIRDLMVANGDAHKSIWISEAAWNAQPEDGSIVTSQYGAFGIVTEEQAARYMPLGYQRAQQEWPWIGNISYWFFKRAADNERNQAFYYFRMVEPDFTPLPVYESMKQFITTQTPVLYPGVHQAEDWRIKLSDDTNIEDWEGAEFGQYLDTTEIDFTAHGTDVIVWLEGSDPPPEFEVNGEKFLASNSNTVLVSRDGWTWYQTQFAHSLVSQTYRVRIYGFQGSNFVIDSITVLDRSFQNVFPFVAAVGIALGMTLFVVGSALRERWRK